MCGYSVAAYFKENMLLLFGHRIIGCSIKLPDYQTVHLIIFVQAAYIISSRSLHFITCITNGG
jgi:hypothetical protein